MRFNLPIRLRLRLPLLLLFFLATWILSLGSFMYPLQEAAAETQLPPRYTELLPYALPAPNQANADNCLYMATTGAVELVTNKYFNIQNPAANDQYDFNERHALHGYLDSEVTWFEDPVRRFNNGGLRNRTLAYHNYNFWWRIFPRRRLSPLPQYKTNWFIKGGDDEFDGRFDVDVFSDKDIQTIKKMLVTNHAPVVITHRTASSGWNTWHTFVLIGYDDEMPVAEKCPIVKLTRNYVSNSLRQQLDKAVVRRGGCRDKGIFYVRDSEDPLPGQSRVPSYVQKTADDIRLLGNNAMQVMIDVEATAKAAAAHQ